MPSESFGLLWAPIGEAQSRIDPGSMMTQGGSPRNHPSKEGFRDIGFELNAALVHESSPANMPSTPRFQAPIEQDAGQPISNILFKMLQAIRASAFCAPG